jgi:hypothetical protein
MTSWRVGTTTINRTGMISDRSVTPNPGRNLGSPARASIAPNYYIFLNR